jgi:hypothetical protein
VLQQHGHDLSFPDFGVDEAPHEGHPVAGADQVELEPPASVIQRDRKDLRWVGVLIRKNCL